MTEPKFKVGDVVKLNSGGPNMTVISYACAAHDRVRCQWINDGKPEYCDFPVECVTLKQKPEYAPADAPWPPSE